jgi:hypothetical protein
MTNKMKTMLMLAALTIGMVACKQSTKKQTDEAQMVLTGTIEGISSGKVRLMDKLNKRSDSVLVENGKFTFTKRFDEPVALDLYEDGSGFMGQVFAENTNISITGKAGDMRSFKVVGGKANLDKTKHGKLLAEVRNKPEYKGIFQELYNPKTSDERKKEIEKLMAKKKEEADAITLEFIKQNPKSHYSAYQVLILTYGESAEKLESVLSLLDQSLKDYGTVKDLYAQLEKMKSTDASIEEFVSEASNVSYKVDGNFKGESHKDVVYLGAFENDNICALKSDGTVQVIDASGKMLKKFTAKVEGKAASLATDGKGNIYVLDVLQEMIKKKVRGRVHEYPSPIGVQCIVHNSNGEEQSKFKLTNVITASGARVIDGKLIVSDNRNGLIGMFNAETGQEVSMIKDMRPCCGILDFSVSAKNELVVANLGAFRVQCFDMTGKSLMSFGKRGKALEDFHGCCNPVSVASLNNGALVTVEKDPTRVKVFSKEGAKQIEGIDEMVKGCSYIPMIVDSKDNLYLASPAKGLVKCVAKS